VGVPLCDFAIEVGDGSFVGGEGGDCFVDSFLCAAGDVSAVGLFDAFLDLEFLFGCRFSRFFTTGFVVGWRFAKTGKKLCVTTTRSFGG